MKYLVECNGFIGDILFASSIAKKLHEQDNAAVVDYIIPLIQPVELLRENPYIRNVIAPSDPRMERITYETLKYKNPEISYDMLIRIPLVNQAIPATVQFQLAAGIAKHSTEFDVYTLPVWDSWAVDFIQELRKNRLGVPVVGYDVAWQKKAYNTREEEILRGVGGPHRNIEWILNQLRNYAILLPIGLRGDIAQHSWQAQSSSNYSMTASLIKACDWMIGCEGGLTNLAAGVHTKTIITSDFIYQLYGPHGLFRPCADPQMGPRVYYPNGGHIQLDPWITDEEVAEQLIKAIQVSPI